MQRTGCPGWASSGAGDCELQGPVRRPDLGRRVRRLRPRGVHPDSRVELDLVDLGWHKLMADMQVGGKETRPARRSTRSRGAAARSSRPLTSTPIAHPPASNMESRTVASTAQPLVLAADDTTTGADEVGASPSSPASAAAASGTRSAGRMVGSVFTSTQGANNGALFAVFNVNRRSVARALLFQGRHRQAGRRFHGAERARPGGAAVRDDHHDDDHPPGDLHHDDHHGPGGDLDDELTTLRRRPPRRRRRRRPRRRSDVDDLDHGPGGDLHDDEHGPGDARRRPRPRPRRPRSRRRPVRHRLRAPLARTRSTMMATGASTTEGQGLRFAGRSLRGGPQADEAAAAQAGDHTGARDDDSARSLLGWARQRWRRARRLSQRQGLRFPDDPDELNRPQTKRLLKDLEWRGAVRRPLLEPKSYSLIGCDSTRSSARKRCTARYMRSWFARSLAGSPTAS